MLDFDPLYSTPQVAAIEQFIDQHYPLAGPVSCRMLQSGLNDVYLALGSNGERYVFRLSHRRARGPADVKTETAFLTHLAQSGVPVAAAVPTREGSLFVQGQAPEGARQAVLFRAIEGRKPDTTDAGDARANGKTLALMHNAAETFQPTERSIGLISNTCCIGPSPEYAIAASWKTPRSAAISKTSLRGPQRRLKPSPI
ncbi:phosphotransferase enzyme family protein [Rhizobium leguminosarum bv. viciae]|jgi:Ser/Thr protein kinase RdoA (MazF antagonist)|nr:phosphotransferase enzyme family protein [Rhizobium leguminosarum bv. viciae]